LNGKVGAFFLSFSALSDWKSGQKILSIPPDSGLKKGDEVKVEKVKVG